MFAIKPLHTAFRETHIPIGGILKMLSNLLILLLHHFDGNVEKFLCTVERKHVFDSYFLNTRSNRRPLTFATEQTKMHCRPLRASFPFWDVDTKGFRY